jgi:flagellar basal-body rod protein FlgC
MSIASSIAVSGMHAATVRLQVSARNIANSRSDGPLPGSANAGNFPPAYVPQRVDQVDNVGGGTSAIVSKVSPGYVSVYDPTAAYADSHGMVASPNVDLGDEIVQLMLARFTFAANAQVVRVDAQMSKALLDILA